MMFSDYAYPRHDYHSGGECPQSLRIVPASLEISAFGRGGDYGTCVCCAQRLLLIDCDVTINTQPGDKIAC